LLKAIEIPIKEIDKSVKQQLTETKEIAAISSFLRTIEQPIKETEKIAKQQLSNTQEIEKTMKQQTAQIQELPKKTEFSILVNSVKNVEVCVQDLAEVRREKKEEEKKEGGDIVIETPFFVPPMISHDPSSSDPLPLSPESLPPTADPLPPSIDSLSPSADPLIDTLPSDPLAVIVDEPEENDTTPGRSTNAKKKKNKRRK